MRVIKLVGMVGLAALVAGCATTAPGPEAATVTTKEKPEMVRITGSRIPQPADRIKPIPSTIYPFYVISNEEMWNTGATSVGDALSHLPSVQVHD